MTPPPVAPEVSRGAKEPPVRLRRTGRQVGGSPHLAAAPADAGAGIGPCVYVLRSRMTGACYLGATANLSHRLRLHQQGRAGRYSATHGPWVLVAYEPQPTATAARQREQVLKRNHRMRFLFIKRALAAPPGGPMPLSRQVGG